MIVTIKYTDKTEEHNGMSMDNQVIDCQRIFPLSSKTHWGFTAYDSDGNMITEHKFALDEGVKAYVMEKGNTVMVLPKN